MFLAVVFEETGAYNYKKNKEAERGSGGGVSGGVGLKEGFEETFSHGEDDPNDYWSGTECNDCEDPYDFST